jgi:hypothetical protein
MLQMPNVSVSFLHLMHPASTLMLPLHLQLPTTPNWCAEDADRYRGYDWGTTNSACCFPESLVKCTCLRQLSLRCECAP